MFSTLLCILSLTELFPPENSISWVSKISGTYTDRLGVCVEVANIAEIHGIAPSLAISVAYQESRFDGAARSSVGAVGPMQVMERYTCAYKQSKAHRASREPCSLIRDGVLALRYWLTRSQSVALALCRYNRGNRCDGKGRRYARSVLRRKHRLDVQAKALHGVNYPGPK
jgi:hypothetical protein